MTGHATRTEAAATFRRLRVGSALIAVATAAGVCWGMLHLYETGGAWGVAAAAAAGLVGLLVAIQTPIADLLGLVTAWSGYVVVSCPYCLAVHFETIGVVEAECADCGRREYHVTVGDMAGGWTYRCRSDGPDTACCPDCSGWPSGGESA